jgi:2-succinyl-5-enolpyruvyl-6-hydroxy-3-cyclohexene-1-carboxylate synthase
VNKEANRNSFWASLVAEELYRAGVVAVCISPGSRSTPLAIACYAHPQLDTIIHIDERSGSFFALGLAKYTHAPVALLCTSGTAAANFYAAIIEAFYAYVPLIVLTADRPPELRDCGAGQTIDQIKLYGNHVRYFFEVGLPELTGFKLRHLRSLIGHAAAIASGKTNSPAGPVHLNFAFTDPLPPIPIANQVPADLAQSDPLAWQGRTSPQLVNSSQFNEARSLSSVSDPTDLGYIQVATTKLVLSPKTLTQLANLIADRANGIIMVGIFEPPSGFANAVKKLAHVTGYPLLAEATGIMRDQQVISSYDAFLRSPQFCQAHAPELVIRFGTMPTSKRYCLWLEQQMAENPFQQIIIGNGKNSDPTHGLAVFINACPLSFCEQLSDYLENDLNPELAPPAFKTLEFKTLEFKTKQAKWQKAFRQAEQITIAAIAKCLDPIESLFEGKAFAQLGQWLPVDCCIYVASSMPIRDLDSFFRQKAFLSSQQQSEPEKSTRSNSQQVTRAIANRGANGIDGTISSALGAAWGSDYVWRSGQGLKGNEIRNDRNSGQPVILICGDLAFYHDLNGLMAAKQYDLNLTIILLNNNGGGIFDMLPIAEFKEWCEPLFNTPHDLNFAPIITAYGCEYVAIGAWEHFKTEVLASLEKPGTQVLELKSNRQENHRIRQQVWHSVKEAIAEQFDFEQKATG